MGKNGACLEGEEFTSQANRAVRFEGLRNSSYCNAALKLYSLLHRNKLLCFYFVKL